MNLRLNDRLIFGVDSTNVGRPVSFFSDNNIAYLAGNTVIVEHLETKEQRFVHAYFDRYLRHETKSIYTKPLHIQ